MDMNKILQNFEDAATGEYTPSKQESSDMKMILESFYNVAQEDASESKPEQLDEIASVTMSGDSADEVAQLVKLMNDAGAPEAAPVGPQPTTMDAPVDMPADGPPDMPPKDTMITPKMMDDFESAEEPVEEGDTKEVLHRKAEMMDREDFVANAGEMGMKPEEAGEFWDAVNGETESYENEPDERYDDHETMTHDLSGGINRRKKSYKRAEPGDNPMAVESSLAEELSSMLKKKMSKQKSTTNEAVYGKPQKVLRLGHLVANDMKKMPSLEEFASKVFSEVDRSEMLYPEKLEKMLQRFGMPSEDIPSEDINTLFRIPNKAKHSDESYSMSEKKDQDGDGDNDFDDVKIARMKASGMSHDEAVAKVKGKKESSKKNSDTEVDEAGKMKGGGDDPCWKGYKMVGTKKKNGKEVPNCVPREGVEEAKSDSMSKKFNKAMSWTADKPAEMKKKIAKMSDQELEKLKSTEKEKLGSGSAREFQIKAIDREMKKRGLTPSNESAPKNNPVAKHAGKFNKAQVQTDKKKAMKKGKDVKHKGKDFAMESAPVFDRYVKPIINKTPKQMVEFYDREARTIINRLSKERRSLAEANSNTKMHDVVIGRLRENLDVVSEAPYRRRSRSSFDIGRTGYGDGRGANLGSDKAAFKRREMEVELGDEEPSRSRRPQLKGMYFYDVPPGKEEEAKALGIKPTKSGKMAMKIYDTSGRSTSYRKNLADEQFGQGKYWSPKR